MGTPVKDAVLLGGGEIRDYGRVASLAAPGSFVVCADSGYRHCGRLGLTPGLLVGDFDSIGRLPGGVPHLPFPAEKDYTDTTLALKTLLGRGYTRLLLAGMLGGRLDHTLANLQSLAHLSVIGADALMTDGETDAFAVTDGEITLSPRQDCYFSLLCASGECRGVTIRGAKYLLDRHTLRFDLPRAVSNEFLGGPVTVTVEEGTLTILVVPRD